MSFTFSPEQSELVTNPSKLRPYVDTLAVTFGHPARVVAYWVWAPLPKVKPSFLKSNKLKIVKY